MPFSTPGLTLGRVASVCRVCGFDGDEFYDASGAPTFAICDCCGAESGYQDATPEAARSHRRRWTAGGTPWRVPGERPTDWNLNEQLARVPAEYRE